MSSHGRKYGEKDSYAVPLWNGIFEHCNRIGDALWEFAWCIDAVTKERDGIGLVLGGAPVKLSVIVKALKGRGRETVRRHLKSLADGKYIRMRRTPYGQIIEVLNSKKFGIWKKEKPQIDVSLRGEKPIREPGKHIHEPEKPQTDVSKEDSAMTLQKDTADDCPHHRLSQVHAPAKTDDDEKHVFLPPVHQEQTEIPNPADKAERFLVGKGELPEVVDVAFELLDQRFQEFEKYPVSPNYWLASYQNLKANPEEWEIVQQVLAKRRALREKWGIDPTGVRLSREKERELLRKKIAECEASIEKLKGDETDWAKDMRSRYVRVRGRLRKQLQEFKSPLASAAAGAGSEAVN